ncbi:50S ribosomal protein L3 N(5)-glutamine methyltransferase [Pseudidiomarina sp. 1APP75-32.1]|uniref:Ribosomal protein uL3 glutamine methyltransferase n=1 Tax=Pseudidiomarina terrestris TaxID=2820060 RepID=A0AAW7QVR1_9GAMM|nr:50S ribosomal protein L3 N(5)-glutamine methyltransferase [Pseudidiomarina sp. 1APP75-32.1]MDN7123501.1 50S ribosomal protein L3 N(5)-glutamine methyltransferase [Pseudidiomarina sp. 1APP75-32.1]
MESPLQEPLQELSTVEDYWRWGVSSLQQAEVFFGHGTDNATSETLVLLAHVLHLDLAQVNEFRGAKITSGEQKQFVDLLQQRIKERKPAAYLTGEAWFAGLPFKVDERVLVPRSPIAELIEQEFQPWLADAPQHILDLCTGSGCIAIACAYAFPEAEVDALDISTDALAVAEENIAFHQLEHRVFPMQSDLYSAVQGQRYDLIVTNPPYVDAEDMADLPAEFHHEPELGLAAGDDGLDLVRTILREAPDHLTEQGILICEVGNSMVHLAELYPDVPFTWLSFERGGDGVFLLTRHELLEHQSKF